MWQVHLHKSLPAAFELSPVAENTHQFYIDRIYIFGKIKTLTLKSNCFTFVKRALKTEVINEMLHKLREAETRERNFSGKFRCARGIFSVKLKSGKENNPALQVITFISNWRKPRHPASKQPNRVAQWVGNFWFEVLSRQVTIEFATTVETPRMIAAVNVQYCFLNAFKVWFYRIYAKNLHCENSHTISREQF